MTTTDENKINLPEDPGDEETTLIGDIIVFASINYDEFADNPSECWDGFGKFHSLSHRHINFNEDCPQILKDDPDAVALSYYEHGLSDWSVQGTRNYPDMRWDGVHFAGVWEPDDSIREAAEYNGLAKGTDERRKWMEEQAASACKTYTYWCNGSCYCFSVAAYRARHAENGALYDKRDDYRHDEVLAEESCGGFYGYEDRDEAVKEAAEEVFSRAKAEAEPATA